MISAGVIRKPLHPRLEVRTPGCNCSSVQKPMKTRVPAILQLCSPGTRCTVVNRPLVQHPSRSAQLHSCARGVAVHTLRTPPRTGSGGSLGCGCSRRRCESGAIANGFNKRARAFWVIGFWAFPNSAHGRPSSFAKLSATVAEGHSSACGVASIRDLMSIISSALMS